MALLRALFHTGHGSYVARVLFTKDRAGNRHLQFDPSQFDEYPAVCLWRHHGLHSHQAERPFAQPRMVYHWMFSRILCWIRYPQLRWTRGRPIFWTLGRCWRHISYSSFGK